MASKHWGISGASTSPLLISHTFPVGASCDRAACVCACAYYHIVIDPYDFGHVPG